MTSAGECYRPTGSCTCCPDCYRHLRDGTAAASDRVTPRGSDEERAFFAAVNANLLDLTARLVFADWLDEHGRTDEGAVLRDRRTSPVITPFRILPYWREARFFTQLRRRAPAGPDGAIFARRMAVHDEIHGGGVWASGPGRFTRALVLDDDEAVLVRIDRWALLKGEPRPIIRAKSAAGPWWKKLLALGSGRR
jgi:uncharacterized protein (TIGR02996 family)